jgi:hypothetical protein
LLSEVSLNFTELKPQPQKFYLRVKFKIVKVKDLMPKKGIRMLQRKKVLIATLMFATLLLFYPLYSQLFISRTLLLISLVGTVALGYCFLKLRFTQLRLILIFISQAALSIILLSLMPRKILIPSLIATLIASFVLYSRVLYEFLRRRYA